MTATVRTRPGAGHGPIRPWMWAASLAAVAALAAGALHLSGRGDRPAGAGPPAAASFTRLTDQEGSESFPSLSPDGNFLLYVKSVDGNADIYLQRVGGGNPVNLTPDSPQDDTQPAVSPDGQRIAFRSQRDGGGLFLMGATGESARRLTDFGFNPAWSPDGRRIAFATEGVAGPLARTRSSQLWVVEVATGRKQLVAETDAVQPSWSPHGHRIAYWGLPSGGARRSLWTVAAGGGKPVQATRDDHVNWNPVWSPDGQHLYFVSDRNGSMNVWRLAVDEASGRPLGEPEPVTTSSQSVGLLSLSRQGDRIVYATVEGKSNLERRTLDPATLRVTGEAFPITQGSRAVRSAAVSPDGQWIVLDTASPQEDLFVVRADGSGLRQLTDDAARDRIPRWLPDGARIVFYSNRGGSYGAWIIRADGSGLAPLPHGSPDALYNPIPSPDGRRLVASLGFHSTVLMDLAQPAGRSIRWLPRPAGGREVFSATSWSADGAYLAGTLDEMDGSTVPGVVLYSLAEGRYDRLTAAGSIPAWLNDGRTLVYLQEGKLFLGDRRSRQTRLLLEPPASSRFIAVTVGPDDRTLYAVRESDEGDLWMLTLPGSTPAAEERTTSARLP
jgi:Tol biopolymer transport system component